MKFKLKQLAVCAGLAMAALAAPAAIAGATLINSAGTIAIGVNDEGHLNTSVGSVAVNGGGFTGLAYNFGSSASPDFRDATAPGCLCEGWGVSASGSSGYANVSVDGVVNLALGSFSTTASSITSMVTLTSLPGLKVTHVYQEATNAPAALFRANVTITNTTGGDLSDVRYVRVMDWDVPPTEFNEFVTIRGTATTTLLERSHNNGFHTANPLVDDGPIDASTLNVDFIDYRSENFSGDHGAYFLFNFGLLADGASRSFDIFYGAAANEREALAAISAEGIELFSLGQSSTFDEIDQMFKPVNDGPTFIFGFKGVGGRPVIPEVPEPGTLALAGLGLAALAALRRRKYA